MGAHQNINRTRGQIGELGGTISAPIPPGEHLHSHARRLREWREAFHMLPREDLCRGHHHALPARLDRDQQSEERHKGLPEPTSPCSKRFIRRSAAISPAISEIARVCALVGR